MPRRMEKRARRWLAAAVMIGVSMGPAAANGLPAVETGAGNFVPDCVTPRRLMRFVRARNGRVDRRFSEIARLYARHGEELGVRWDVAFFQMMVETAALSFRRGDGTPGDVGAGDNNFAGLGAVGDGKPGERFETPSDGVRGHLEHVLLYAGRRFETPVAQRTRSVQRWGVLVPWHAQFAGQTITYSDVALRWAPGNVAYLETIIRLAQQFQAQYCDGQQVIARAPRPRQPQIASTAWAFALPKDRHSGIVAPTGRPALREARSSLGRVPEPTAAVSNVRPAVTFQTASLVPLPTPRKRQGALRAERPITQPARVARPERRLSSQAVVPPRLDPMAAQEQRIRDLISGRKVLLKTRIGATIPILFDGDGTMRGHAGSLGFFLGASQDSGKWWTQKGRLCQRWRTWLDGDVHCIRLKERAGLIHWQADDGEQGTARVVAR